MQSAGKQEDFFAPANELAAKLGWSGDPDWELYDIRVEDALGFIIKTMHEHHIAGATGKPQPDYKAVCEHLSVDNDEEQAAIDAALKAAYESGKGVPVTNHPIVYSSPLAANLTLDSTKLVDSGKGV